MYTKSVGFTAVWILCYLSSVTALEEVQAQRHERCFSEASGLVPGRLRLQAEAISSEPAVHLPEGTILKRMGDSYCMVECSGCHYCR